MKIFATLALAALARAQYFSAGWNPGQTVQKDAPPTTSATSELPPSSTPVPSSGSLFDMTNFLSSPPVVSLFSRFGVNITEKLAQVAAKNQHWDSRIPLITDDNYRELIVNETLTTPEEKDRMWFMVVSVTASRQEGISKYLDEVFDEAYNTTVIEGDLPDVRWGRIDYLNVTFLTTKWVLWQAPYLVFATDRGQTLRFVKGNRLRLNVDAMRQFLKEEKWKTLEPWSSAYSPGGSREWIIDYFALVLTKIYNTLIVIPKWALFVISGAASSLLLGLMHKSPPKPTDEKKHEEVVDPVKPVPTTAASQTLKRAGTKQRRSGKK